jgi:hypothetical protein
MALAMSFLVGATKEKCPPGTSRLVLLRPALSSAVAFNNCGLEGLPPQFRYLGAYPSGEGPVRWSFLPVVVSKPGFETLPA